MAAGTPGACRSRRLGGRPTHARALRCRSETHMDWFTNWALEWQGVFALVFMITIATFLWRTLKLMPQTKPVQIKPDAKHEIGWEEIAGVDEAKDGAPRGRRVPARPQAFQGLGAKVPKGILLHGPPGHRQDAAGEGRRARVGRPVLLAVRRRRSSRCSPASAPPASGACSTRRARTRPRSSSSTSSTPSAAARGSDNNSEREQTLNQLLVEMDGFPSQRPRRRHGRVEPAREARPRAAAARAASTARSSSRRPTSRAARAILDVHTRNKPLATTSTSASSPARRAA